jgi:hypothetical protein
MLGAVMPEPVAWWLILEVMGAIVFRQDKVTIYEVSREEGIASER